MEYLDIITPQGELTGRIRERSEVHREGEWHRTAHVWVGRRNPPSRVELLLQKRSKGKDSFPGCYDISSAGHIPAGQDFEESAVRELKEELGIAARPEELLYCGLRRIEWDGEFYGEPFLDRQLSRVYLLWRDGLDIASLTLQKEEVEEVRWIGLMEVMRAVRENTLPHCIFMEELEMVRKGVMEYQSVFGNDNFQTCFSTTANKK